MAADPVKYTLALAGSKSDAVRAAGSTASANVIVEFDQAENQLDIINALQKCIELVREEYGTSTS